MFMWFRSITVRLYLITQEKVLKALNFGLVQEYTLRSFLGCDNLITKFYPFALIDNLHKRQPASWEVGTRILYRNWITNNWSLSSVSKIIRAGLFERVLIFLV